MLKFEHIDQYNIEVSVMPPEELLTTENENETRELGDIIKDEKEDYLFFTTPTKYFHALWWMNDEDLQELKQKLLELNGF